MTSALQPSDFPISAIGQYLYRQGFSGAIAGPMDIWLAADIAHRLNRDHVAWAAPTHAPEGWPTLVHGRL